MPRSSPPPTPAPTSSGFLSWLSCFSCSSCFSSGNCFSCCSVTSCQTHASCSCTWSWWPKCCQKSESESLRTPPLSTVDDSSREWEDLDVEQLYPWQEWITYEETHETLSSFENWKPQWRNQRLLIQNEAKLGKPSNSKEEHASDFCLWIRRVQKASFSSRYIIFYQILVKAQSWHRVQ